MLRDPEGNSFLEASYGARRAYQILSSRRADRQQLEQLYPFGRMALAQVLLEPTPFCRRDTLL